jgi:hypothetical protein
VEARRQQARGCQEGHDRSQELKQRVLARQWKRFRNGKARVFIYLVAILSNAAQVLLLALQRGNPSEKRQGCSARIWHETIFETN